MAWFIVPLAKLIRLMIREIYRTPKSQGVCLHRPQDTENFRDLLERSHGIQGSRLVLTRCTSNACVNG